MTRTRTGTGTRTRTRYLRWRLGIALSLAVGLGCREGATPAPSGGSAEAEAASRTEAVPPPDPAPVRELVVHDLTPPALRLVDLSGDVDGIVRQSFDRTKRILLPPPAATGAPAGAPSGTSADGYDLGVGILYVLLVEGQPVAAAAKGTVTVIANADMGRRSAGRVPETYEAVATIEVPYDPATDGPLEPIARRQVERAVDDARTRLVARLRLAGGSDAAVLAMLHDADPAVRAAAAREAGERRLKDAAAAIAPALADDDRELRQAALGALGRIGDRSVVPAVARLTQGMDAEEIRLAVFALGDIGGPEARRYLETIAYSHPMPEIRHVAEAALDDESGDGGTP